MNYTHKNINIYSKFLNKTVTIIIALPLNYQINNSYSTYLIFDGNDLLNNENQNILFENNSNKIFIGISCDNNIERFNNWSTYYNYQIVEPMKKKYPSLNLENNYLGGNGINFINFITKELLIFIKNQEQIKIQDLNLFGCSMGAYFCLQMLYLSNLSFKKVILFSPSIWFNETIINDLENKNINNDQKLIVNVWVGLKEPKLFEKTFNINYYQDSLKVKNVLTKNNKIDINFNIDDNGGHGFKWWITFINQHQEWW